MTDPPNRRRRLLRPGAAGSVGTGGDPRRARRRVVAIAQAVQRMGWRWAPAVIWPVSAVLILWYLDHSALWHDETSVAGMGRQILQGQGLYAFDGRNLWGGANGVQLNASDFR